MAYPDVLRVHVVDFGVPFDSCIEVIVVRGSQSHDVTVNPKLVLGRGASCGGTDLKKRINYQPKGHLKLLATGEEIDLFPTFQPPPLRHEIGIC